MRRFAEGKAAACAASSLLSFFARRGAEARRCGGSRRGKPPLARLAPCCLFLHAEAQRRKGAEVRTAKSLVSLAKVRAHCILLRLVGDEAFSKGAKASAVKGSAP